MSQNSISSRTILRSSDRYLPHQNYDPEKCVTINKHILFPVNMWLEHSEHWKIKNLKLLYYTFIQLFKKK